MGSSSELLKGASSVGERLRRLMDREGISISELHRRSGVSQSYISDLVSEKRIEGHRKPSAETLFALGVPLGVSVDQLIGQPLDALLGTTQRDPSLQRYVTDNDVSGPDAKSLAGIHFRGKGPSTPEEWALVHATLKQWEKTWAKSSR